MAELMVDYKVFQCKLNLGIQLTAPSLQRLFIHGALAMVDHQVKLDRIREVSKKKLELTADRRDELFRIWLNRVLKVITEERFLPRRVVFDRFDGKTLEATIWGEAHAPLQHGHLETTPKEIVSPVEMGQLDHPDPHFYARVQIKG